MPCEGDAEGLIPKTGRICPNTRRRPGVNSITVVQASRGNFVATIGGLNNLFSLTFDGERILATNVGTHSVSIFKAGRPKPHRHVSTGAASTPYVGHPNSFSASPVPDAYRAAAVGVDDGFGRLFDNCLE
jgi:hypothetical protein